MLEYPFEPHKIIYTADQISRAIAPDNGVRTLAEAESQVEYYCKSSVLGYLRYFLDDIMHVSVINALKHTTDVETRALATARIPSGAHNDNTIRFIIAFLYEQNQGMPILIQEVKNGIVFENHKYRFSWVPIVGPMVERWVSRADKIVEIMEDASDKVGELSQNADAIRNAALIDLGEKTGLELTSKANAISFNIGETSDQGNTVPRTLAANSSFFVEKASDFRVAGTRANNTDTLVLTSKNGPNEITVTTNRVAVKSVLAKDATKTLVDAELMGSVVTTQPIEVPASTRELPDITDLEVAEVQSVNIQDLFNGIRVNVTAVSSDIGKVTVSVNENTTSMGVTGVAIGTSTITVTGTNEAGAVSVSFDVTIIAAEE